VKATTDGVVRKPSAFEITFGSPASSTVTALLVVPRSMPTALPICCSFFVKAIFETRELVAQVEPHVLKFDLAPEACQE
jgi:hypothetical protein